MVERIGEDSVLLAQDRLEQTSIGVEAARIEDGVFGIEEMRYPRFQQLVFLLGATDETNRRQAVAVAVERLLGRADEVLTVGQAQIIVGAEIQDTPAVGGFDLTGLS